MIRVTNFHAIITVRRNIQNINAIHVCNTVNSVNRLQNLTERQFLQEMESAIIHSRINIMRNLFTNYNLYFLRNIGILVDSIVRRNGDHTRNVLWIFKTPGLRVENRDRYSPCVDVFVAFIKVICTLYFDTPHTLDRLSVLLDDFNGYVFSTELVNFIFNAYMRNRINQVQIFSRILKKMMLQNMDCFKFALRLMFGNVSFSSLLNHLRLFPWNARDNERRDRYINVEFENISNFLQYCQHHEESIRVRTIVILDSDDENEGENENDDENEGENENDPLVVAFLDMGFARNEILHQVSNTRNFNEILDNLTN